jgi:ketosteroid isomerase-like protein
LALALALPSLPARAETADETAIRRLNQDHIRAFVTSDVSLYRELLADDFRAVLADGREINKAEFLRQAALPSLVASYHLDDVWVRQFGDTALVTARLSYRHEDGSAVRTFYVDVYVRREGRWRLASAQFTRLGTK